MKEKTKTNWEHFYNDLFTLSEEIHVAHKKVYWCVMQGTEERCSAKILQQLTKEDTEQTCRENNTGKNYCNQKLKHFLLNGQAPHTQTHTRTK